MPVEADQNKYEVAKQERTKYLDAILASDARKKVVVAGPGTGKTHLFKEILINKPNSLTLSFVNSLVEDLSLDLCGLSEVRTLHSFARGILGRGSISPRVAEIIKEDAGFVLGANINFEKIFYNRQDDNEHIPFYSKRLKYYRYFGYTDIVFAAVRALEKNPAKIPAYDQVLIDEFQDFNKLEVSLIDLLAQKSPIVIVGDDDQALYNFKDATPDHIRSRHADANEDFASFTLPYCSRCTRVIVDAINDILGRASNEGKLKDRVVKKYLYFDHEDKDKECDRYPKIPYAQMYARQIPWFIENQLSKAASEIRSKFSVLIICPIKSQCRAIAASLKKKGFRSVTFVDRDDDNQSDLKDGLKLLLDDDHCNLGWRIAAKAIVSAKELKDLVQKTHEDEAQQFVTLIPRAAKVLIRKHLAAFRKIHDEREIDSGDCEFLFEGLGVQARELAKKALHDELEADEALGKNAAIRNLPIKITTIQSSKGLADDVVFIANFDDRYLVKDSGNITDHEICSFLVAMTRARKKVFLISSQQQEPIFLKWISDERIERL